MMIYTSVGVGAGFLGALLGLGGGIILVPALSLWCGVPVKTAIAASAFVVLVNAHLVGLQKRRLEMVSIAAAVPLQLVSVVLSLVGAYLSVRVDGLVLERLFGATAVLIALIMFYFGGRQTAELARVEQHMMMVPHRTGLLMGIAGLAGVIAGALGVGGGIFLVPAMQFVGKLPIKVATATSSYTMAVTGAGAAVVYLTSPYLRPGMTTLCLLGAVVGGVAGNHIAHAARGRTITLLFAATLMFVGVRMWMH